MDLSHFWWQAPTGGAVIGNSLRFRDGVVQNLSRTISGSATSDTASTVSFWYKRGKPDHNNKVFDVRGSGTDCALNLFIPHTSGFAWGDATIGLAENTTGHSNIWTLNQKPTEPALRDFSAWYHIVLQWDSNNGVSTKRAHIWVNGVEYDFYNYHGSIGAGRNCPWTRSGRTFKWGYDNKVDGYLSEVHLIDGQILDPTNFAEKNTDGVWVPKKVSGVTYGTNGWYLDFSDPADIGADRSGNGNNFTATGFELTDTTSALYDWMADSPTDNYATLNPLDKGKITTSNANLKAFVTAIVQNITATQAFPKTGKWYFEQGPHDDFKGHNISIADQHASVTTSLVGQNVHCVSWSNIGELIHNGAKLSGYPAFGANDVVGALYDADANTVTFYKNGAVAFSAVSTDSGVKYLPFLSIYSNSATVNYGNRPLQHLPAGAKPLSTVDSSAVAITNPSEHFTTITDTGANLPTNCVATFPHGLWYMKSSANAQEGWWFDSINGPSKSWHTPGQDVRQHEAISGNGVAYGWSTNASGLNTTAGFQMISYTGNGNARTVAHSLGAVPAMIWIKQMAGNKSTVVYHRDLAANQFLRLNDGNQPNTDNNKWNNTRPTSSVFSLGSDAEINENGQPYMAYVWTEIPGYSAFGRYHGNNNVDGVFQYCDFRPAAVCTKAITGGDGWFWRGIGLDTYNPVKNITVWKENKYQQRDYIDFVSNGWKARCGGGHYGGSGTNTNGEYVWFAFAEHPFGGSNVSPAPAR